jgi:hypothetical protein
MANKNVDLLHRSAFMFALLLVDGLVLRKTLLLVSQNFCLAITRNLREHQLLGILWTAALVDGCHKQLALSLLQGYIS